MGNVLLVQSDARHIPLQDASVHMCVTSPPYWALRDYGTGQWYGGSAACDHSKRTSTKESSITTQSRPTNTNHEREGWRGGVCGKCGALRQDDQLGLEALYSCGRIESGVSQLRRDLTPKEVAYVIAELQKAGLL